MLKVVSCSPIMNMHNIYRYAGVKQVEVENLSSHIVEVQMLGSSLLNVMNTKYGENMDYGEFLKKALHHDLEESITGDITRPLKYHNHNVHKELENVADEVAENLYAKYFPNSNYFDYWKNAKKGKEGILVKVVDMLVVAIKAFREVELLNNNYFLKVVFEVNHYLTGVRDYICENSPYNKEATEYILDIIDETLSELQEIKDRNSKMYSDYRITDLSMVGE